MQLLLVCKCYLLSECQKQSAVVMHPYKINNQVNEKLLQDSGHLSKSKLKHSVVFL